MNDAQNTVLETGAAMGIGRAVAEVLSAEGKTLVLFDSDGAALEKTASEIGGALAMHAGSVASHGACDEAANGVRVLGVAPGAVETPMLRWAISLDPNPAALDAEVDAMHPIGRRARPEEIAAVISFLLSDKASFMTGETVRVDGGMLARIAGAPRTIEK